MSDSLLDLEKRRSEVLAEISTLGDFRPGSISATSGRAAIRIATVISRTIPAMAPTCGSPTKCRARPLPRAFPPRRRSAKPSARSLLSGNFRN